MCAAFALNLCPAGAAEPAQVERPRLVVGIVVGCLYPMHLV